MAEQITTAAELDALLAAAGEMAEPVVVREGFRVWILTEDEDGRWWAWSWREDDEEGLGRHVESLRLPLTVLYRPDATALPIPDGPKMLRETLCVAQHAINARPYDEDRKPHHSRRLQVLIDALDETRPLGPNGKHGNRHTPSCGCGDAPAPSDEVCQAIDTTEVKR